MENDDDKIGCLEILILSIFVVVFVAALVAGPSHSSNDDDTDNSDEPLAYQSKQVQTYSKKTLTKIYQDFPDKTKNAKAYDKAKTDKQRTKILSKALLDDDFGTLVTICHDQPTALNKAFVYACCWDIAYDNKHMKDYAKCLMYYCDHLSRAEKRQMVDSKPLHDIVHNCRNTYTPDARPSSSNGDDDTDMLLQQQLMQQQMMQQQMMQSH